MNAFPFILGAAALLPLYLTFPGHAGKDKRAPFLGRNIAHRGLYAKDQSVPENSLPAFRRAIEYGYGIELDVQLTRDERLIVFHDDKAYRMCGNEKRIDEIAFEELSALRLANTNEKVPEFTEVLRLIDGKAPLIIEIKSGKRNALTCRKTLDALRNYKGEYCIESFDPRVVSFIRFHAPKILRGGLAQPANDYVESGMPRAAGFILGNMLMNFISRPQFIAYKIGKKPFLVRLASSFGAMKVAWTAHDAESEGENDTVIFEHFTPETRFERCPRDAKRKKS